MVLLGKAFYRCYESLNLNLSFKGDGALFVPLMVIVLEVVVWLYNLPTNDANW